MFKLNPRNATTCGKRYIAKLESSSAINWYIRASAKRANRRLVLYRVLAVATIACVAVAVESTPRAQSLINPPTPPAPKQVHDTGERKASKLPVAYADDTVTITFHNCRENAKEHWSCQRVDGDDTDHYVYIPGLHPAQVRASSFANSSK